jgi:hypothetical protein
VEKWVFLKIWEAEFAYWIFSAVSGGKQMALNLSSLWQISMVNAR